METKTEQIKELNEGDIMYNSWGYDQTNIDFYKVIAKTKCMVKLRKLKAKNQYDPQTMTGQTIPTQEFDGELVITKKPYIFGEIPHVKMKFGSCKLWDGKLEAYSDYA